MSSLLSLVRRSIRLNALKMIMPADDGIESQRCAAWHAIRAAFPNVPAGQLERVINEGVERAVRQLERGLSRVPAANDPFAEDPNAIQIRPQSWQQYFAARGGL